MGGTLAKGGMGSASGVPGRRHTLPSRGVQI